MIYLIAAYAVAGITLGVYSILLLLELRRT